MQIGLALASLASCYYLVLVCTSICLGLWLQKITRKRIGLIQITSCGIKSRIYIYIYIYIVCTWYFALVS